jgi:hypothetical protein
MSATVVINGNEAAASAAKLARVVDLHPLVEGGAV